MRPKPFVRVCCLCRSKQEKKDLIRLCRVDGKIIVDKKQVLGEKGVYFCKECAQQIEKTKALSRAFKCNVSKEAYEEVIKELKGF